AERLRASPFAAASAHCTHPLMRSSSRLRSGPAPVFGERIRRLHEDADPLRIPAAGFVVRADDAEPRFEHARIAARRREWMTGKSPKDRQKQSAHSGPKAVEDLGYASSPLRRGSKKGRPPAAAPGVDS